MLDRETIGWSVFRDGSDPILIGDLNGIVVDLNAEVERAYGWPRDELIGKPIKTLVPSDRHHQADDLLRRCRAGEEVRHIEGLRVTRDGTVVPVLLTLSLLKDDTGTAVGIATTAADLSALKRAEERSAQMSKVLADGSEPMIIEDLDGIVQEMNAEAERVYGFSRDELLRRCRGGEEVRNIEGIRINKEGVELPVLLTLSLLRDDHDEPVAIASNAADIAALKQAGAELRSYQDHLEDLVAECTEQLAETNKYMAAVLESMTQGLIAFDENLKLVAWNSHLRDIRGYPEDLCEPGQSFETFMQYDIDQGEFGEGDAGRLFTERVVQARRFEHHAFERTRPDGRILEIKGGPIQGGGFVSTFDDVTERRQAERALATAHGLVTESIDYSSRIQRSLLPPDDSLSDKSADHFVVWQPRDVVGGDLYWLRKCRGGMLLVLADCTGHGVPGAFVTIIATGALDRALTEFPEGEPATLLARMNRHVQTALSQDDGKGESDDGLELGICRLDDAGASLTYAGARFDLWHGLPGEAIETLRGDKSGIGYIHIDPDQRFTAHELPVRPGERFYMSSDGMIDQIGGERRRALGKRRIREFLAETSRETMTEQRRHLLDAFADYQGNENRRDDVSMLGFQPLDA